MEWQLRLDITLNWSITACTQGRLTMSTRIGESTGLTTLCRFLGNEPDYYWHNLSSLSDLLAKVFRETVPPHRCLLVTYLLEDTQLLAMPSVLLALRGKDKPPPNIPWSNRACMPSWWFTIKQGTSPSSILLNVGGGGLLLLAGVWRLRNHCVNRT